MSKVFDMGFRSLCQSLLVEICAPNDVHTFKKIVAFSEGKKLDEISKQREIGKRPYQTVSKFLFGACLGAIVAAIALWLAN